MYFIIVKVCSSQAFILEKSASDCCGTRKEKNGRINKHGEGHSWIPCDVTAFKRRHLCVRKSSGASVTTHRKLKFPAYVVLMDATIVAKITQRNNLIVYQKI